MRAYELPTSLNINGVAYTIRTDFRAIIDILIAMNDPDLDQQAKTFIMLQILYEEWQNIPFEDLTEACQKACDFIDCGQVDDPNKPKPRLMDWEQDGDMIVPAVNKVAGKEIRAVPYMHWWTFFGYFMESGECLFNTVVGIRSKKAKGEKLDKWEKKFYQENKSIIDIKTRLSDEEQAYKDALNEMLNGISNATSGITRTLNNVVGKVNSTIGNINSSLSGIERAFSFSYDVTGPTGNRRWGYYNMSLPRVNTIPYLAKGAVIPPRSEFLAVLGDQKQGNNIETPEALLRKIVREESGGQQSSGNYRFTAQINRRTVFDEIIEEAKLRRDTSGRNPFELA